MSCGCARTNPSALYPYQEAEDDSGLNWAWLATAIGSVSAAVLVTRQTSDPKLIAAATLAGGWLGARFIKPS